MAEYPTIRKINGIVLSPSAEYDLAEIHTYTTHQRGLNQADRYIKFLADGMKQLGQAPQLGRPVTERPGLLGHILNLQENGKRLVMAIRFIYQVEESGIYVLRILHTAMNLTDHIADA